MKVLIIEDNIDFAKLIVESLRRSKNPSFKVESVDSLKKGIERLGKGDIEMILLDLILPDSRDLDTFLRVHEAFPAIPIVVFTALDNETIGLEAVKRGAQDYLLKSKTDLSTMPQTLLYAIERYKKERMLLTLSLIDELTSLNNRRGFLTLAEQQLKLARRSKRNLLLVFVDLDHLKVVNDKYGHSEGDKALKDAANILRATFRESDILARLGGDEFAILAIEASDFNKETILLRLKTEIEAHNKRSRALYQLYLSAGAAEYNAETPCSLAEFMIAADEAMYKEKQALRNEMDSRIRRPE